MLLLKVRGTQPDLVRSASLGSSGSRLTAAERNEEDYRLASPAIGLLDRESRNCKERRTKSDLHPREERQGFRVASGKPQPGRANQRFFRAIIYVLAIFAG